MGRAEICNRIDKQPPKLYDVGYRLIRKYWGQGIATEAAIASLEYAFDKLNAIEVYAMAHCENYGSNKEGFQKFILPDVVGTRRFVKIGFAQPKFWANFTGAFDILCGALLRIGLLTRLASISLFIIVCVAFIKTKYPILIDKGFLAMAHEYRTDFALTLLLLFLLYFGWFFNWLFIDIYKMKNRRF